MHQTRWPKHPINQNFRRGIHLLRRLVVPWIVLGIVATVAAFGQSSSDAGRKAPSSAAQTPDQKSQGVQQDQNIPDAPSAVQPPPAVPDLPPTRGSEQEKTQPSANQAAPAPTNESSPAVAPPDEEAPGPRPPLNVK